MFEIKNENTKWYFEKINETTWIEYNNDLAIGSSKQLSLDYDANGFPVAIIKLDGQNSIVKLVSLRSLYKYNQSFAYQQFREGYWLEKDGI